MKSRKRPSRTVLLGGQATRTHRSSAQAGLLGGSLAWGCGQARRTAWASRQKVASPSARPCPAPATYDASRARPSGNKTEPPIAKLASSVKNKVRTCSSADLGPAPSWPGPALIRGSARPSPSSSHAAPERRGCPAQGRAGRRGVSPDTSAAAPRERGGVRVGCRIECCALRCSAHPCLCSRGEGGPSPQPSPTREREGRCSRLGASAM